MKNKIFDQVTAMQIKKEGRSAIKSVQTEHVFTFPKGVIGFDAYKEYVFLLNEKVKPFMFMQALNKSDLLFICIPTFLIKDDYALTLPQSTIDLLKVKKPEDVLLLSIVTVRSNERETTANLMSPIAINMRTSQGEQVLVEKSQYPVQFKIWNAIEANLSQNNIKVG